MKQKKFLTEEDRLNSLAIRSKNIIESFSKEFNRIKRIDEETVYQNLEELDYNDVYSKVNPNNRQGIKINDYPTSAQNLDNWYDTAKTALGNGNWKEKDSARHRFLMDDDELLKYYQKLEEIKKALAKSESGEELSDFEKKVVRFYKTDKGNQASRIHNQAGNKIDQDYVNNYQSGEQESKTFPIIDNETQREGILKFVDGGKSMKEHDAVFVRYKVLINDRDGYFDVHHDGSNGFRYAEAGPNGSTDAYIKFKDSRPSWIYDVAAKLQKIRPKKQY